MMTPMTMPAISPPLRPELVASFSVRVALLPVATADSNATVVVAGMVVTIVARVEEVTRSGTEYVPDVAVVVVVESDAAHWPETRQY